MQFIWTGKINCPVKFPFANFVWNGVYGLQIGCTFIGIVKGKKQLEPQGVLDDLC